jgi:L-seryl-tRNA(Ser) seleniumtransferase
MVSPAGVDPRRLVPPVDQVMQRPEIQALVEGHGRPVVLRHVRAVLDDLRRRAKENDTGLDDAVTALSADVAARVEAAGRPSLVRLLNATGVVVHTNLGRAPLSPDAAKRVSDVVTSYTNLEYDVERGERGNREVHAEGRLRELLGVESTAVVNNCAAAVLLAVNTLAEGREVLVSRGELVEIGGSFRIPDVVRKGGARLREVGTTNRTRIADYRSALSPDLGLILKVHPSNFRIVGFTEAPSLEELADLAQNAGVPLMEDQGSGLIDPLPGALSPEATVPGALKGGAGVVAFSGDKLLGGPQAGLLAGRRDLVGAMRRNPLYRALRVDKMTLAALDATLAAHESGRATSDVPVLRMVHTPINEIRNRAKAFVAQFKSQAPDVALELVDSQSAVGGGSAPTVGVPTVAISVTHPSKSPDALATALRSGQPPVVARVADDRLLVDLRTVPPEDEETLLAALVRAARD